MNVHAQSVPTQVAVIGGGAAGLAAARRLHERGIGVLLLEARARLGGRAFTLRSASGAYPVELGAEFIHGAAEPTMELLRECGQSTLAIGDTLPDTWEAAQRVLDRVDVDASDVSVDAFLNRMQTPDSEKARALIEGFDAAITADASIIAVAREWRSEVNQTQSRPSDGYGVIMGCLAAHVKPFVKLNTSVREVRRHAGGVEILAERDGAPLRVHARCAIVTVPIGVLRSDGVRFVPELPERARAAIDAIAMGPVTKVVLEFRRSFWNAGFFQTPNGCAFPTLWSRAPQPAPLLVAWAGGDAANRLAARTQDPVEAALDACARVFPAADVRAEFRAAYVHDWQRDPYARGAYSYLRVGGGNARRILAEPIEDALIFAGEATCEADAGTVAGALASGYRAAEQAAGMRVWSGA